MSRNTTKSILEYLIKENSISSIRALLQGQEKARVDRGENKGKPYGFLHHRINKSILEVDYNASPTFRGAIITPASKLVLKSEGSQSKSVPSVDLILALKWDWNYTSLKVPRGTVRFVENDRRKSLWLLNYIYYFYSQEYMNPSGSKLLDPNSGEFKQRYKIRNKSSRYETTIGFSKFESIAKKIFNKNKKYGENNDTNGFNASFHRELMKADVSLHCQCNAFKFYYSYAATKKKSAFPGMEETRPASNNNPNNVGIGCKHIHSILSGPIGFSGVVKKCIEESVQVVDNKLFINNRDINDGVNLPSEKVFQEKIRKNNIVKDISNLEQKISKLELDIDKIEKLLNSETSQSKIFKLEDKKLIFKYDLAEKKNQLISLNKELDSVKVSDGSSDNKLAKEELKILENEIDKDEVELISKKKKYASEKKPIIRNDAFNSKVNMDEAPEGTGTPRPAPTPDGATTPLTAPVKVPTVPPGPPVSPLDAADDTTEPKLPSVEVIENDNIFDPDDPDFY